MSVRVVDKVWAVSVRAVDTVSSVCDGCGTVSVKVVGSVCKGSGQCL